MVTTGEGIGALILNLILPGLGTVIWGPRKNGIWQLVLTVVGWVTMIFLVGFIIYAAGWIWALVDSIKILKTAK